MTLTGAGGIGKTQLSLQVGQRLLDAFPDGVWLVELSSIADPALIPNTAAYALRLLELPGRPTLEILLDYLQDKYSLLILDNCEHLINETANFVERVLLTCPKLKLLANSRETLGVPGEVPYQVQPLSFPVAGQAPSFEEWKQYDAMRLFAERAAVVLPDFQVTQNNLTPLAKICQQLDGIPLALELAAVRVKMLTIEQIASRLDDRFRLLTGASRTVLPRQQTLRASIDWSWKLLSTAEQGLLRRLSVFAGEINLEAVEGICATSDIDKAQILDLLAQLVNKSLVIVEREPGEETRYRILETIRQYGGSGW